MVDEVILQFWARGRARSTSQDGAEAPLWSGVRNLISRVNDGTQWAPTPSTRVGGWPEPLVEPCLHGCIRVKPCHQQASYTCKELTASTVMFHQSQIWEERQGLQNIWGNAYNMTWKAKTTTKKNSRKQRDIIEKTEERSLKCLTNVPRIGKSTKS